MHKIDHLDIDGRLLETFLAVFDDCSVTAAATRLSTNQSTVSHRLDRLRILTGDDLFVRAGRGIVPTPRAHEIAPLVRRSLDGFAAITAAPAFAVGSMRERFVIAATDYERGLFLIDAVKTMMQAAPLARFDFVWDRYDSGDALRHGEFDLALSPTAASDNSGLYATPLFADNFRCFYDAAARSAPDTLDSYLDARHVRIIFSASDSSFVDNALLPHQRQRIIATELPSLNELPAMLRGSEMVATLPARLEHGLMAGFAKCAVPFELPPLTYSLFWHRRTHSAPSHSWVRQKIIAAARPLAHDPGGAA